MIAVPISTSIGSVGTSSSRNGFFLSNSIISNSSPRYWQSATMASLTLEEPVIIISFAGAPIIAFAQAQPRSRSPSICTSSITQTSTSTSKFSISIVELICVASSSRICSSPVISEDSIPFSLRFSYPSNANKRRGAK